MLPNYRLSSTCQGYEVYLRDPGFEFTPIGLQKFASFIVRDSAHLSVYAFAYSVLIPLLGDDVTEHALLQQAEAVIHGAIDAHAVQDRTDTTYEYRNGVFSAVQQPRWWLPSFA